MENCRIGDLQVDPAYQRSTENGSSKSLIRKIAMFWDWSLFHPLSVSRREDGSLWVVDGQHRLAAARLRRDVYDLPCIVSRYPSQADEAASFVAMNVQRRPLSAIDLFNAALAAGDDTASEIAALMRSAGLILAAHSNYTAWKPRMVSNIGGIRECHRRFGAEVTRRALHAVAVAFDGQILRYGGTLFASIAQFLFDQREAEIDDALFAEILAGAEQREWVSEIESARGREGIKRQLAGARVLAQAYHEAVHCDDDDEPQSEAA